MGLDAVEIIMAVEDAFDIRFENYEGEKLVTPRLLIDFIFSKVSVASSSVCLTHRAFNLLRKALLRQGGWKRSDIAPATSLSALMPKPQRRALLEKVITELGIKKPPVLNRPKWLTTLLFGVSVLLGLLVTVLVFQTLPLLASVLAFFVFGGVAILTGFVGAKLTKHQCTIFPKGTQTVGEMSRWVMAHKSDLADNRQPAWTREQIAMRVREIVTGILNCAPHYHEDANFVEELGMY